MDEQLKNAFDQVHAGDALKAKTREQVLKKARRHTALFSTFRRFAPVLACMVLVILGAYGLYFTPTAAISIDVNPSLELTINRFDRVISATGFNDDGEELLDSVALSNLLYTDAIEVLLGSENMRTLLSGDALLEIGIVGDETAQTERMLADMDAYSSRSENISCYFARAEEMEAAHALGLTCGKYRVYTQLQSLGSNISAEQVQSMTMRQLRDMVSALSGDVGISPPVGNCDTGNGQGNGYKHGQGNG